MHECVSPHAFLLLLSSSSLFVLSAIPRLFRRGFLLSPLLLFAFSFYSGVDVAITIRNFEEEKVAELESAVSNQFAKSNLSDTAVNRGKKRQQDGSSHTERSTTRDADISTLSLCLIFLSRSYSGFITIRVIFHILFLSYTLSCVVLFFFQCFFLPFSFFCSSFSTIFFSPSFFYSSAVSPHQRAVFPYTICRPARHSFCQA